MKNKETQWIKAQQQNRRAEISPQEEPFQGGTKCIVHLPLIFKVPEKQQNRERSDGKRASELPGLAKPDGDLVSIVRPRIPKKHPITPGCCHLLPQFTAFAWQQTDHKPAGFIFPQLIYKYIGLTVRLMTAPPDRPPESIIRTA